MIQSRPVKITVAGNTYPATNQGDGTWTLADDTITPHWPMGTTTCRSRPPMPWVTLAPMRRRMN